MRLGYVQASRDPSWGFIDTLSAANEPAECWLPPGRLSSKVLLWKAALASASAPGKQGCLSSMQHGAQTPASCCRFQAIRASVH